MLQLTKCKDNTGIKQPMTACYTGEYYKGILHLEILYQSTSGNEYLLMNGKRGKKNPDV